MLNLYYTNASTVSRSVMLTTKALGLELNKKKLSVSTKDHLNPEYIAINFQHTTPTLVDGDLTLWESRAICTYLISKYGKDDVLYPKCPRQRAMVDRLLYFDFSYLNSMRSYFVPLFRLGKKPDSSMLVAIQENLSYLNKFLEGHDFAVGNSLRVADLCLVATTSTAEAIGMDLSKHNNVVSWLNRCKTIIPGYQTECENGAEELRDAFIEARKHSQ